MYTLNSQHGTSKPSTIKTEIDNWYVGTTLKDNNLVVDTIFCNDRSATTSSGGIPGEINGSMSADGKYYYGDYVRNGQLKCPTSSDKFTMSSINWNGMLTYPVGLITLAEARYAGISSTSYSSAEIYLNTKNRYWTGTPCNYGVNSTSSSGYIVSSSSYTNSYVSRSYGIRPVISLSSKAILLGGGTWDNVYTVIS